MTFHAGQKVVCVESSSDQLWGRLVEGRIYTISGWGSFLGTTLYDVAELKTPIPHGWYPRRFRALVEKKTDISIFTDLLLPTKEFVNG